MSDAAIQLGHKVRTLRSSLGMTQEQLAEGADISLKHLGEIERGRGNPTLTTLLALSAALHISPAELMTLGGDGQPLDTASIQIRALVESQGTDERLRMLRVLEAMLSEE